VDHGDPDREVHDEMVGHRDNLRLGGVHRVAYSQIRPPLQCRVVQQQLSILTIDLLHIVRLQCSHIPHHDHPLSDP
jgi:hypothetical protein